MPEPINAPENDIAKMFCMPLKTLKRLRREKKFTKEICFTVPNSARILYSINKFKEWFENNKEEAHINFNSQIKEAVARFKLSQRKHED